MNRDKHKEFIELAWYVIAIGIVLALGLSNLFYPLGTDQASIFIGALEMDRGAVLYRNLWDNKQPGLYYFYLIAGRLFSFSEMGIHLLELIWMLSFSFVMMVALRGCFHYRWLSAITPVATIGIYYATAGEYELTQLEMIVGFPIFVAVWLAIKASTSTKYCRIYLFFSGFFAGIAVLFKLILAPIFIVIWLIIAYEISRQKRIKVRTLVHNYSIPIMLGTALPLIVTCWWFYQENALDELLWTAFVYPPQAFQTSPAASPSRLISAGTFFLSNFAPWLFFVVITLINWSVSKNSLWIKLMLSWTLMAIVLFLVQRFSWYNYHTLLWFTPVGILAVKGIDYIVCYLSRVTDSVPDRGMVVSLIIALPLCLVLANPFLSRAEPLLKSIKNNIDPIHAYQMKVSENYLPLWRGTQFLREDNALKGPIYAFGNALVYRFSGRAMSHDTVGSSWEFYLPDQLANVLATLDEKSTPYLFIDRFELKISRLRPTVAHYIQTHYEKIQIDESGIWYRRKGMTERLTH